MNYFRKFALSAFTSAMILTGLLTACTDVAQEVETDAIAKVGDAVITERELAFATADLGQQFAQVPEDQRRAAILNALIDIKVLASAAESKGLDQDETFKARMTFLRSRALHNSYYQDAVLSKIDDAALQTRYDKEIAALPKSEEVSARHILVKTEEEAKAIIEELDGGADFVVLAKSKSTGPSGPNGGDLGYFGKGQMVPEFEAAVFALEKGQYTKVPVQTQFGWHVIKKEDQRIAEPPGFDDVKEQIRQMLARERYLELVKQSRSDTTIEVLDADLKKKLDAIENAN